MKQHELKKLIQECVSEEIQSGNMEEGFFDTVKHLGRGIAGDVKQKTQQAVGAVKQRVDTARQQGASDEFKRIQTTAINDLTASYKKALEVGAKAKMSPQNVKKIYISALTGMINKIRSKKTP
jgi:hypothetical protein